MNADYIKINKNIYAVIHPNRILYVHRELNNFRNYSVPPKKEKERNDFSVTFVPTLDCNLRCIYCYSRGGDRKDKMPSTMPSKFLRKLYNPKKAYRDTFEICRGWRTFS